MFIRDRLRDWFRDPDHQLVSLFVLGGVLLRFLPHPWNISPLTALALFSGAFLRTRLGVSGLIVILFLSDLVLGFHRLIPLTWGSFIAVLWMGRVLKTESFSSRIVFGSLAGSCLFYLVTNLGVFLQGDLYPPTATGFVECYIMALPFFRNMLIGDVSYTIVLFGSYYYLTAKRERLLRMATSLAGRPRT